MNLFAEQEQRALAAAQPLAARMRPRRLDEFIGQEELLAPGTPLRRELEADRVSSMILYGPPGCGKTTLARIIAAHTAAHFEPLHASDATVKELRAIGEAARGRLAARGRRTIVFIDEIHRFTRTQQDALLRDVEDGLLCLIGATTENPFAALSNALTSRTRVYELQPLSREAILGLLRLALTDAERGLGTGAASVAEDALALLADQADGDARRALNALEIAVRARGAGQGTIVTREDAAAALQRKAIRFDAAGDQHYDVASAFIKSLRGSDPDAALHWLARMLEGGEDPRFIARRLIISASEDVGNADPQALLIATAAAQAVERVGLPECHYALAQAATYLACAPKSDAVNRAIAAAREDVRNGETLPVPDHLRDQTFRRRLRPAGAEPYRSPHADPEGFLVQDYMTAPRRYYEPLERGFEAEIARRLARWRERIARERGEQSSG